MFWELFSASGYLACAIAHGAVARGYAMPRVVLIGLLVAMFPPFLVAILGHPAREVDDDGVGVPFLRAFAGAPAWLHLLTWGSLAYAILLIVRTGSTTISFTGELDLAQTLAATWSPTVFYAGAWGMLRSARAT